MSHSDVNTADDNAPASSPMLMQSPPGPEVIIDNIKYLYFGGTSYMGLAAHPEVIEAGCLAMKQYGVHSATSRAKYGTNPTLVEVENNAKQFFDTQDAFYFGSGYMSNHIMVSALKDDIDTILIDQSSHYCVIEAATIAGKPVHPFNPNNLTELKDLIKQHNRILLMADAVGPSSGNIAPLNTYLQLLKNKPYAAILLDDAHGFGVLGDHGRGVYDAHNLWSHVNGGPPHEGINLFVCGTLAKGLGGFGGIIPGTDKFISNARAASHYFDGASAPASPVAGATAKALELLIMQPQLRQQLQTNIKHIREGFTQLGFTLPPGQAANFGATTHNAAQMQHIHETLKTRGILLPYVAKYSGIPPEGVLRVAVFANHQPEQIDKLLTEIRTII